MKARAVAGALLLVATAGRADEDWISDQSGVLEVQLAHRDVDRVDGGTLRVDRERRVVTWEGAPNEIGCRRPWQASFDDLVDVRADPPGFVIAMRTGAQKEVRLAPLPHFQALIGYGRTRSMTPEAKDVLRGPDGDFIPFSGSGSSTTPTLTAPAPAPQVQRDSARAVEAILRALGRAPR